MLPTKRPLQSSFDEKRVALRMTVLHTQPLDEQLAAGLVGRSLNSQNFNAITSTHYFYFSVSETLARAYRISDVVWTVKIQV